MLAKLIHGAVLAAAGLPTALAAGQTVTTFAPSTNTTPGVWYESNITAAGAAATVDLTGTGGTLEGGQPLPIGAALLTTTTDNNDRANVGVFETYGTPDDIFSTLSISYSYYKASNPGQNLAAAPALKLSFFNSLCDDPASAGDCFGLLVFEPTWNQPGFEGSSANPPLDTWQTFTIDENNGLFWWTGGFGQPNTAGGPPLRTLAQWRAIFSSDFGDSDLALIEIGVGSFNQLQIGYFDDVQISHSFGGGLSRSYDFEPPPPAILELQADAACYDVGSTVVVDVNMVDQSELVVGGQFFMEYDTARLTLVSVDPGDPPFDTEVYECSTVVGAPPVSCTPTLGEIDYAVGLSPFGGPGTSADTTMARITFTTNVEACDVADLVRFRDPQPDPPTRLTNALGDPIDQVLVDMPAITIDGTPPVITCPPPAVAEWDDVLFSFAPGSLFGTSGATTGGISIYYNATGPQDLTNAAYLRTQVSLANLNGAEFFFDTTPLTGLPLPTWDFIFSGIAPLTQFGLDIVRPLPTDDSSVVIPTLIAVDNTDSTPGGAIPAGPVSWMMTDYKPNSPSGPTNPSNAPTNSIIRGPVGGDPLIDIEIVELSLVGTTLTFTGRLSSDSTIHWFDPLIGTSPMSNFLLNGEFFISGTLTLAGSGAGVDHYAGPLQIVANSPRLYGIATAVDNCTLYPAISFTDGPLVAGGPCPEIFTFDRTWEAVDDCGNASTCIQPFSVVDTTPPDVSDCPDDIETDADVGGCTASVSWTPPTVSDFCDPSPTIEYDIDLDDNGSVDDTTAAPTYVFPPGTHRVTVRVFDSCDNLNDSCDFTVTVNAVNDLLLSLSLSGAVTSPLTRCITLELWECPGAAPSAIVDVELTFVGGSFVGVVPIPCGSYTCMTARDTLHTLRRTLDTADGFGIVGTQYVADFISAAKPLLGGNLNDDPYVDILDFGVFFGEFGVFYDSNLDTFPDGDTICGVTPFPHADVNGDGTVDSLDFGFIQLNFLVFQEPNCCGAPLGPSGPTWAGSPKVPVPHARGGPVTRISVIELKRRGLGHLAAADLTRDGMLDHQDIAAFLNGAR
jgi:hypothetical protein